MDNLTHTLVGLMMARAGLEKTTARGAGMMMIAANMPDIDALAWFGGTGTYIEYHRSYTHALPFTPLVALLPMLIVRAGFSWRVYLASILGVLSHLVLDWTNPYGIPLLLPFTNHRFRLDMVNIVDLIVWGILLGALAAAALAKLVSSEIGTRESGARRGWAWAALLALLAFEGFRFTAHQRAVALINSRLYEGAPPKSVAALPGGLNPLAWRGVVEGDGFAVIVPVNLLAAYDPSAGRVYHMPMPVPAMEAALQTQPFRVFRNFAQLPFWRVQKLEDGIEVQLMDLRFSNPDQPGFAGVTAVVDRSGIVRRAGFGL